MTFFGVEVVSVKKLKLTYLLREIMSDITYVHAFRKNPCSSDSGGRQSSEFNIYRQDELLSTNMSFFNCTVNGFVAISKIVAFLVCELLQLYRFQYYICGFPQLKRCTLSDFDCTVTRRVNKKYEDNLAVYDIFFYKSHYLYLSLHRDFGDVKVLSQF